MSSPGVQNAYNAYDPQQPAPVEVRPPRVVVDHYCSKLSILLGVFQIIFGPSSIVLQIVVDSMGWRLYSSGVWCGIFVFLAGAFGLAAGVSKKQSRIKAHLVLSIIAACMALAHIIILSILGIWSVEMLAIGPHTVYVALLFLALAEGLFAIIASAISCHGLCCGPRRGVAEAIPATQMHGQGLVTQVAYVRTASGPQQILIVSDGAPIAAKKQTIQVMAMSVPPLDFNTQGNVQAPLLYTETTKPGPLPRSPADAENEQESLLYQ